MLEDLDFSDDIVLISPKYEHIQNKTNRIVNNTGRVGLKLNAGKCEVMSMNAGREDKVEIGSEEVEDVEEFVYLGATVTKDGGGTEDIKQRLNKALGAFFQPDDDLESTEYWSEHENQTAVWMPSMENNSNRREEAGSISVHMPETDPKNMVNTTCPK